jgi:hypothetical protein
MKPRRCIGPGCHQAALPGRWLCLGCGNRWALSPEGRRADAAAVRLGEDAAPITACALADWIRRVEAERLNGGGS